MIHAPNLDQVAQHSVQSTPQNGQGPGGFWTIFMASIASRIIPWGQHPVQRDYQLRQLIADNDWMAAITSRLATRNAAFQWNLKGPERTCNRIREALHLSESMNGGNWLTMMQKVSQDLYNQDNGAFIEIVRQGEKPTAPLVCLNHIDAGQCTRTGNPEYPVIYADPFDGSLHKLGWWQVIMLTDMPSPIRTMNGMQICALSRMLRYAEILHDISVYQHEKVSGRFAHAVHFISGIGDKTIEDALLKAGEHADNQGTVRYQKPVMIGAVDPTVELNVATLELKSLPDGWDLDTDLRWFIALAALAYNCDYQDLAPLPGQGLGSSAQSQILHLKSRGLGPALFRSLIAAALNFYVMPSNVEFVFEEKDIEAQGQEAQIFESLSTAYSNFVNAGILTPEVARQKLQDDGHLRQEYLDMLGSEDVTPDVVLEGEGQVSDQDADDNIRADDDQTKESMIKALADDDWEYELRQSLETAMREDVEAALATVGKRLKRRLREEVSDEA